MNSLAPIGDKRTPSVSSKGAPQSALAAFAKTRDREDGLVAPASLRPVSPGANVTHTLKPMAGREPAPWRANMNPQPLDVLDRVPSATRDVSALSAFGKQALASSKPFAEAHDDAEAAKRPTPLKLSRISAMPSEEKETKRIDTADRNAEDLKANRQEEYNGEMKQEREEVAAMAKPTEMHENPSAVDEKAGNSEEKPGGESNEEDDDESQTEFACMESEDEDGPQKDNEAVYVDDLYDHSHPDEEEESVLRAKQRIFLPRSSKQDLFHAILVHDLDLLIHTLSLLSPNDVLAIRDAEGRTMYHYAAMSKSREVQAVAFNFISCHSKQETDHQISKIEAKQRHLGKWRPELASSASPAKSTWVAPRIKEVQTVSEQELTEAYLSALHAHDWNGRSFIHYSAVNLHLSPFQVSRTLSQLVKTHHNELLQKDSFDRDALEYAIMAQNTRAVRLWFTQLNLGAFLSRENVDRLTQFKMAEVMQRTLYEVLEDCEGNQSPTTKGSQNPGLSIHLLAKLPTSELKSHQFLGTRMWTSLHKAVIFADLDAVRHFIHQGVRVNDRDADGWTPLHHCASRCSPAHLSIAEFLLMNGADVNMRSLHGRSPLHLTAMHPLDPPEEFSAKAIHCATRTDSVQFAAFLLDAKAKLDIVDEDYYTPLLAAVRAGNIGVARFLLESQCNAFAVDKTGGCVLHIAVANGLEAMIRFLCWWDASVPIWESTKDHRGRVPGALVRGGHTIRHCLDRANLWYGARLSDAERVRQQIRLYKSINKKAERAKHIWIHDTTPQTARTALHLAIEPFFGTKNLGTKTVFGPTDRGVARPSHEVNQIVAMLLEEKASISVGDKWGITPLMLAACLESPILVETMLQSATQEDLKASDITGNLAIHYSYAYCRAAVSTLIEEAMDDPEIENLDGRRPLSVTGMREKLFPKDFRDYVLQMDKRSSQVHTRK